MPAQSIPARRPPRGAVLADEQLLVIDDLLDRASFRSLWRALQNDTYRLVHEPVVRPVWRPGDGLPMQGSSVWRERGRRASKPSPLDGVVDAILARRRVLERWVGRRGRDWNNLSVSAFLYPAGSGLGWHDDGALYSGAFTYYAHPEWSASWGGELMIADVDPGRPRWKRRPPFDASDESEALMARGFGRFIQPRPNRLVILRSYTPHKIATVSASAGDHVRATVAGFFVRPGAGAR